MQETTRMQKILCEYFQFDESDLAANRLGAFSERQKRELKTGKKDFKRSSLLVGAICLGVGLAILFLLIGLPLLQGSRFDWVDIANMLPSLLIPLAFLAIGIYSLGNGLKTAGNTLKHYVASVTGAASISEAGRATYHSPYRRRVIYELRVGEKEFHAYDGLPRAVTRGDVYTVYFDSADDEILSVEWVSNG